MLPINNSNGEGIMVSDKDFFELKGQVTNIDEKMDELSEKFERVVFGNGQKGLYEITKANALQIESIAKEMNKCNSDTNENVASLSASVSKVLESISALGNTVQAHISDTKKHLIRDMIIDQSGGIKSLWVIVLSGLVSLTLFFIIIHTLIPKDFDVWQIIAHWLGL